MTTFDQLGLNDQLLQAVKALGFVEPTPIQAQAIPVLLSGTKDFVGLAQTGTGKTAAFGLPLLQLVDVQQKHPQALIICPTRELCMQITNDLMKFNAYTKGIYTEAVYGGASIVMQMRNLKKGVQLVIATPGRLIDLIERKAIQLQNIKYVVLDEADEMLNMGFREDIDFVLKNTINRDSMWMFSATMPSEVRAISKNFMKTPHEITVGKQNTTNVNINHQYYVCAAHHRYEVLKRLIDFNPGIYGIIFVRTKLTAQEITEKLLSEGYDIEALHGDLSQQQRDKVMQRFRQKSLQLIIATDVAARGIDVEGITHVFNYELPDDLEVYTHRAGRTARAGKSGICVSICHSRELGKIRQIERIANAAFHKMDIPQATDVCRKQFFFFMDKLMQADMSHGDYETFLPDLVEKFKHISKEEVLQRVAALEFSQLMKYYQNAEDLNARDRFDRRVDPRKGGDSRSGGRRGSEQSELRGRPISSESGFTKLFINLGIKDGFYKASFLQYILDESRLNKDVLGRIDLHDMHSYVEIDQEAAGKMIRQLNGKKYKSRMIRVNDAASGRPGGGGRGGSREGGRDRRRR